MIKFFRLVSVKALLLAALLALPAEAPAESATFTLAPPDGIEFKSTFTNTVTSTMKDLVNEMGEAIEAKREMVSSISATNSARKAGALWELSERYTEIKTLIDGEAQENPLNALLANRQFTTIVDTEGNIKEMRGFATLLEDLERDYPPEAVAIFSLILDPEALEKKAAKEWYEKYGNYIGATVEPGFAWVFTSEYDLPGGATITYFTVATIEKVEKQGDATPVLVNFYHTSKLADLGDFKEDGMEALEDGATLADPDKVALSGSGYRIIDAETMLVYGDEDFKEITMKLAIPGQTGEKTMTLTDKRVHEFEY